MPLISRIEELRPHLPVAYANGLKSLPAFDNAEDRYILPVIGAVLYNELQAAYDAESLSDDQARLLKRCRAVIAPFAYLEDLAFIQVKLTDNGLIALEAEGSRKAYKWEYNEVSEALKKRGYAAQEALISFLRANLETYPAWATAPYNDATGFGLIRFGEDLAGVTNLQQTQRTYALVKGLFDMVAQLYLEPAIGAEFYAVLNDHILTESFTPAELSLIKKLRGAAARWVMKHAAIELNMRFDESGFTVTSGAAGAKDNAQEGRAVPGEARIAAFIEEMESTAQNYMSLALAELQRLASNEVFPEFFVSPLYVDPAAPPPVRRRNDGRRGLFVAG